MTTAMELRLMGITLAILVAPFIWASLKLFISWETTFGIDPEKRYAVWVATIALVVCVFAFHILAAIANR